MGVVKDGLAAVILKANPGTTLFRDDPWAILNAACCLHEEALFSEALIHVVGRGGAAGCKCLLPGVQDVVDKYAAELEAKVNKHWQLVLGCCYAGSIPQALAAMQVYQYFQQHSAFSRESPLRPNLYQVLAALHHMDNIKPLLRASFVEQAEKVDDGLYAGQNFIHDLKRGDQEDGYDETMYKIADGLDQWVNEETVESNLREMLQAIKEVIKPLFVGDRKVGYFTCMQFAGPFPWSNTSLGSP